MPYRRHYSDLCVKNFGDENARGGKDGPRKWQDVLNNLTKKCDRNTFSKLLLKQDCSKMVSHCLDDISVRSQLISWMDEYNTLFTIKKNASKGRSFRVKGNERFRVRDYEGSRHFYSLSVRHAPFSDEEFPLAVANRSAALYHLEYYQDSLNDIDLAISSGYPTHLHYKLLLRKGKIHLINKNFKLAISALKESENCMPPDTKSFIRNELEEALSAALAYVNLISEEKTLSSDTVPFELPSPTKGENPKLKYASSLLSLRESSDKGRHLIANDDIKKGDLLFVEKPFAFVILPDSSSKECDNCCKTVWAQIPCRSCVRVIYCSKTCCDTAWEKYHKWECDGLEIFYSTGIAHLGLRLFLVSSSTEHDERYDLVMSLMSHVEDMVLEDAYQYCLTATLLTLYLEKYTNFFLNKKEIVSDIGGMIMYHVCQLICNGHAITKIAPATDIDPNVVETSQESVASAIFPSASMMNHSCDPSVINSFHNEYIIIQAVKDIKCGQEVFNCYGPYYRLMKTTERKEALKKQYFFDCNCPPCRKAGNKDFLAQFSALLCNNCDGPLVSTDGESMIGKCLSCGNKQIIAQQIMNLLPVDDLYHEAYSKTEDEIDEAIKIFKMVLSILLKNLYRYNIEIRGCRDKIAKFYAIKENYQKSAKYLIDSIEAIEKQFGEGSIEVAYEYQTLTDLLLIDIKLSKYNEETLRQKLATTKHYVDKAIDIFKAHYGFWNEGYRQIIIKDLHIKRLTASMLHNV